MHPATTASSPEIAYQTRGLQASSHIAELWSFQKSSVFDLPLQDLATPFAGLGAYHRRALFRRVVTAFAL